MERLRIRLEVLNIFSRDRLKIHWFTTNGHNMMKKCACFSEVIKKKKQRRTMKFFRKTRVRKSSIFDYWTPIWNLVYIWFPNFYRKVMWIDGISLHVLVIQNNDFIFCVIVKLFLTKRSLANWIFRYTRKDLSTLGETSENQLLSNINNNLN